jgi:hypothetical protein
LAPHDPEQRLKLLIHRLDGFRRFLEIKSMHDAVRTRYGNSKCRRPPARADLPPHYKHGRLSRPQPFAGAAMVTIAALTTPNVIVFLSDIDRSVCWYRENAGLAEATCISATFCSRSFHPIRCDFVAALSRRTMLAAAPVCFKARVFGRTLYG